MELIHETQCNGRLLLFYILHIYKEGVEREKMEVAVPDGTLRKLKICIIIDSMFTVLRSLYTPTRMDSFLL